MLKLKSDEVVVFTSKDESPICGGFEVSFDRAEEYRRDFGDETILANIDRTDVIVVIYNIRTRIVRVDLLELTFDLKSPSGIVTDFFGQTSGLVRGGPYIDSIVTRLPVSGQYLLGRLWNRECWKKHYFPHPYQVNHKLWKTIYYQLNDSRIEEAEDYQVYWMDDNWQERIDTRQGIRRF